MLSMRARIALWVVRKQFNVNPYTCKDQIKRLQRLNGPDNYVAPEGWTRETKDLGEGASMEYVYPPEKSERLIYVLHGGAYIAGLIDRYRGLSKMLSDAAGGAAIAFLNYRLAPDYKYPCALDDALKGWGSLIKEGYHPSNIVAVGDSAGGNLLLALLLKLRDMDRNLPRGAICMSPWADMTASGKSYRANFKLDPMFGGKMNVAEADIDKVLNSPLFAYCGDHDRKDPYVSPVYGQYIGFPPMLFTVGSTELLLDDTLRIAEKLKKADVPVKVIVGEKMFHVWPLFNTLFPEARKALNEILAFIKGLYQ